jgi:hypothetical protein
MLVAWGADVSTGDRAVLAAFRIGYRDPTQILAPDTAFRRCRWGITRLDHSMRLA